MYSNLFLKTGVVYFSFPLKIFHVKCLFILKKCVYFGHYLHYFLTVNVPLFVWMVKEDYLLCGLVEKKL